jgi:hypothetical protein
MNTRDIQSVESFSKRRGFFERWKRDEGGKTTKRKTPKRQERRVMSNRESKNNSTSKTAQKKAEHN